MNLEDQVEVLSVKFDTIQIENAKSFKIVTNVICYVICKLLFVSSGRK